MGQNPIVKLMGGGGNGKENGAKIYATLTGSGG